MIPLSQFPQMLQNRGFNAKKRGFDPHFSGTII